MGDIWRSDCSREYIHNIQNGYIEDVVYFYAISAPRLIQMDVKTRPHDAKAPMTQ